MSIPQGIDIYRASAGSGKTFSLTLHYLTLALSSPTRYRHILAVTFTNKATAEMKERIVEVLAGLATGSSKVELYRAPLLQHMPGISEAQLQQRALEVYTHILHDYSRFSVSTIDRFVQRIVRSFAWELGIDGGFRLQLDTEPVKEDLANRLNMRLDTDKALQRWMVDMAVGRLDEGKSWNFRDDMLRLANELFKERFKAFENTIGQWSDEEVQHRFATLSQKVKATQRDIEERWVKLGQEVVDRLSEQGLDEQAFYYGKGGFISYFYKAANGELNEPKLRVRDAAADGKMEGTKLSPPDKAKVAALEPYLRQQLQTLLGWYDTDIYQLNTAGAIDKHLKTLRLMQVFVAELANYRKENNALLISDTTYLLNKLTDDTNTSFIYEKAGQRYQHFLIDEFQDTSAQQWQNFLPLLQEALGAGNYNLVVGDVKQAIYRWRSGDWRLLLQQVQQDLKQFFPTVKNLQENYRSTEPVIHFNNLIFCLAPMVLQNAMDTSLAAADNASRQQLTESGYDTIFTDAYSDSFQNMPTTAGQHGLVCMKWVTKPEQAEEETEDESEAEQAETPTSIAQLVLKDLYAQVQSLLAEGFAPGDLAILTRQNNEARLVVEYLTAQQKPGDIPFGIISGDALLLGSNEGVQLLISAMQYLHNGQHTIALAHVRQLVAVLRGLPAHEQHIYTANNDDDLLPPQFFNQRMQLRGMPVGEMLHQLIMLFGLHQHSAHAPYLLALADKVQEWSAFGEATLHEFLQHWADEGSKWALPAKPSAETIEVVTVHKSKGLAYEVVLMPFLNWALAPEATKAPTLWVQTGHTPFNDVDVVPVLFNKTLAKSAFAPDYYEELLLTVMDNLNVLYVAFTRAKSRLYGWAPHQPKKSGNSKDSDKVFGIKHVGELLMKVAQSSIVITDPKYADMRHLFDEENLTWQYGTPRPPNTRSISTMPPWVPAVYTHWQDQLTVRYQPLQHPEDDAITLPRAQGIMLHEMLSAMQTPDQLDAVMQQYARQGWADADQALRLRNILEDVLAMDVLQPWHQKGWQRLAERSMLTENRELRRPDLILYNQTTCLVYDFKFTAGKHDHKAHQQQVMQYMQLLQRMGFAGLNGFVVYGLEKKSLNVLLPAS